MCRWVVYVGDKVLLADIIVRPRYAFLATCRMANSVPVLPLSPLTWVGIQLPGCSFTSIFSLEFEIVLTKARIHKNRHSLVSQTHERFLPGCTTQWTMSSMVSMIKRNAAVNADGFGVGWYNLEVDPEPCVFTSIAPAEHNTNLARLSKKIQSHLIFGHVRAASPGSSVNDTNCHPFQFGRYLWMHNGCIAHWTAVKRPLTALLSPCSFAHISGTTDSEVAGAVFLDQLPGHDPNREHSTQDIADAMKRTIQIITQSVKALNFPRVGESSYSSLNFAVSDGKTVVATRYRDSPTEEPPSLYYCTVSRMEMVANEMEILYDPTLPPMGVVIASEPLTYQSENWTLIPKNHMIVVSNGTDVQLLPIIDNSEIVCSRWIEEFECTQKMPLCVSSMDLNNYFSVECCAPTETPCSGSRRGGILSAPPSPHMGMHRSPQDKSALILESPIMAGALRALLASATPSQLREILESNLLPCRASSSSAPPVGDPKSIRIACLETENTRLDYAAVSSLVSPSSSMASLPTFILPPGSCSPGSSPSTINWPGDNSNGDGDSETKSPTFSRKTIS